MRRASTTIDPDCVDQNGTRTLCLPATGHTATKLTNGTVLILGGKDAVGAATPRAVVFNPLNNQFSEAPFSLINPRSGHTATILADGRVLVAGGCRSPIMTGCAGSRGNISNS